MTDRPYSRIYHQIVDDPDFDRVYGNRTALGAWLQMLLTADAMYPASAPMPPRDPTVRLLIASGLIIERPGNRYSVKGLQAERERRSASGRIGAAKRWHSERIADAMPRRDETSKDKTSIGANAPAGEPFMGFRPKASAEDIRRQEDEAWKTKCADCGTVKRKHPSATPDQHAFRPELRSVS